MCGQGSRRAHSASKGGLWRSPGFNGRNQKTAADKPIAHPSSLLCTYGTFFIQKAYTHTCTHTFVFSSVIEVCNYKVILDCLLTL